MEKHRSNNDNSLNKKKKKLVNKHGEQETTVCKLRQKLAKPNRFTIPFFYSLYMNALLLTQIIMGPTRLVYERPQNTHCAGMR